MARTQGHGNPKWTREETILALDLYFDSKGSLPSTNDPSVVSLSKFLVNLPIHSRSVRKSSFRNPAGVAFKLQNIHQAATGEGLDHLSAMDQEVWGELGKQRGEVAKLADAIRKRYSKEKPS